METDADRRTVLRAVAKHLAPGRALRLRRLHARRRRHRRDARRLARARAGHLGARRLERAHPDTHPARPRRRWTRPRCRSHGCPWRNGAACSSTRASRSLALRLVRPQAVAGRRGLRVDLPASLGEGRDVRKPRRCAAFSRGPSSRLSFVRSRRRRVDGSDGPGRHPPHRRPGQLGRPGRREPGRDDRVLPPVAVRLDLARRRRSGTRRSSASSLRARSGSCSAATSFRAARSSPGRSSRAASSTPRRSPGAPASTTTRAAR